MNTPVDDQEKAKRAREDEITAAFDRYALEDPEDCDVSYAFAAQSQVVLADEYDEELAAGYEALADDPEDCDVEWAFAAQSEVVLADEGDDEGEDGAQP